MSKSRYSKYKAFQKALDDAHTAASAAQSSMVEDVNAFNCGFAWVTVHDRSFNMWCHRQASELVKSGDKSGRHRYGGYGHPSGRQFWCPGNSTAHSVDIMVAGAKAFSESLSHSLQIRCEWSSRLD
jgi:hypothetical protein